MARLNKIIEALEAGKPAITTFAGPSIDNAIAVSSAKYDGVVFESEHNPYDIKELRHCLQYMLNRKQILDGGTLAPAVTPTVRIPPNGGEMNQWLAKQVLDIGYYGIVWPHVSTVEEAYNAVAACRYPRPRDAEYFEPEGQRGDAPGNAARYWGLSQQEYYKKADVWPLNPEGEILCIIMCEEVKAIENLPDMLKEVPGIGVVLIGEGDLSQNLGHPRDYYHPIVVEAMAEIRAICKEHNVPVGHPHVGLDNIDHVIEDGYRYLMVGAERSYNGLNKARELGG
ncbi:MAG: aldolase/citrate lyase family protein, partial [Chloroflexota bacterium]|nr:aldolase/citrate lyase family protein [Chloroflexota bacterium]